MILIKNLSALDIMFSSHRLVWHQMKWFIKQFLLKFPLLSLLLCLPPDMKRVTDSVILIAEWIKPSKGYINTDARRKWSRQDCALFRLVTQKWVIIRIQEMERAMVGRMKICSLPPSHPPSFLYSPPPPHPYLCWVWWSDIRQAWAQRKKGESTSRWNNKVIISSSGWHLYCSRFLLLLSLPLSVYPFLPVWTWFVELFTVSLAVLLDLDPLLFLFSFICLSVTLFFLFYHPVFLL